MIYGLLGIIILILIVLLIRKHQNDFTKEIQERNKIQNEVDKLKLEKEQLEDVLDQRDEAIRKANKIFIIYLFISYGERNFYFFLFKILASF